MCQSRPNANVMWSWRTPSEWCRRIQDQVSMRGRPDDSPPREKKMANGNKYGLMALRHSSHNPQTQQSGVGRKRRKFPGTIYRHERRYNPVQLPHLGVSSIYPGRTESVRDHWNTQVGSKVPHRNLFGTLAVSRGERIPGFEPAHRTRVTAIPCRVRRQFHHRPVLVID